LVREGEDSPVEAQPAVRERRRPIWQPALRLVAPDGQRLFGAAARNLRDGHPQRRVGLAVRHAKARGRGVLRGTRPLAIETACRSSPASARRALRYPGAKYRTERRSQRARRPGPNGHCPLPEQAVRPKKGRPGLIRRWGSPVARWVISLRGWLPGSTVARAVNRALPETRAAREGVGWRWPHWRDLRPGSLRNASQTVPGRGIPRRQHRQTRCPGEPR